MWCRTSQRRRLPLANRQLHISEFKLQKVKCRAIETFDYEGDLPYLVIAQYAKCVSHAASSLCAAIADPIQIVVRNWA